MFEHWRQKIYEYRARWGTRRLLPWVQPGDRVLDIGAGDCRLSQRLARKGDCEVVPVDVEDFNRTTLPLTRLDGLHLPFPDKSFDVALLLFVLHHAEDARAVLQEALRVCRRSVLVFEDVNLTRWDRWTFRAFHRWLAWSEGISRPHHELTPDEWSALAGSVGLREHARTPLGRQLGPCASRHVLFVWEDPQFTRTRASA